MIYGISSEPYLLFTIKSVCYPYSWLFFWSRRVLMDPCFINYRMFTQKILLFCFKQHSESSTRCWFWSTVDGRGTHFLLTNVHANYWIHCLPISHATWIYDWSNWFYGHFCCFLDQLKQFTWSDRSASFTSLRPLLISIPPLKRCCWWSKFRITLIKPLLSLNSIFTHHLSTRNSLSSIVFNQIKVTSLKSL